MMIPRGMRALGFAQTVLILLLAAGTLRGEAFAQANGAPTADQLEVFRKLPPDQQRALLDALATSGSGAGRQQSDAPLSTPAVGTSIEAMPGALADLGPPRVDGRATLVLDVTVEPSEDLNRAAVLESRRARILA